MRSVAYFPHVSFDEPNESSFSHYAQLSYMDQPTQTPHHRHPPLTELTYTQDLQKATASEPLTLPEEYAMQSSWRQDADKLTFIVCTNTISHSITDGKVVPQDLSTKLEAGKQDAPDAMIGDVNLFLYADEDEDEDIQEGKKPTQSVIGEVEIMIARSSHQGQGYGKEILLAFLWYVMANVDAVMSEYHSSHGNGTSKSVLRYLRVKIDAENTRSIRLFEGAGFKKTSEKPNYFGELELRRTTPVGHVGEVEKELGFAPHVIGYP
ncbi:hypothetical protein M011DRAFT_429830 [Sporormia fimetaria CBS 119925]|uniref:N-acetyltransferase domain-containing protein n=1 Tax=Sporormia fimetaria CBS 119925 TaxID=1340428 RepID=A0A6A6V2X7_9PLEO|nr:hypothetical protein M011DRAFT_429830 [Sporormia fimetaria CBS 119925]